MPTMRKRNWNQTGSNQKLKENSDVTCTKTIGIRPLRDRIVIERDEPLSVTPGGIYLADNAKEPPARGTVLVVGEGKRKDDGTFAGFSVKVGDRVLFAKYAGESIGHDEETYLILREGDVMAVIELDDEAGA